MKSIIKNIVCSLFLGYLLIKFQSWLETDYLTSNFFQNSLVTLLVALVAINSATLGIVLSKIRDMLDKTSSVGKNFFTNTKNEMILSINEQIIIIAMTILLLMARDAEFIKNCVEYINILIAGCFIYALLILQDTAKSVFQILDF